MQTYMYAYYYYYYPDLAVHAVIFIYIILRKDITEIRTQ